MEETAETALQEVIKASFSFSCPRKFIWIFRYILSRVQAAAGQLFRKAQI